MVARIDTIALIGIEARRVEVQVQLTPGLPAFTLVGLADKTVGESRERVRAAIAALGLSLPAKRITINLAPADLLKEGSHFDLPIALGLLIAMGAVPQDALGRCIALGELSLDGRICPVSGVLPAALYASETGKTLICPEANGAEAAWAGDIPILAADSLLALINHFRGTQVLSQPQVLARELPAASQDMAQIRGQETARRALEVAAAGAHNLLMVGPPGAGKSLLASCLPGILPPLTSEEMLEISLIASVSGLIADGRIQTHRPFRDPHHSSSLAAMVGGGKKAIPGEISLAHLGVLFLDELPEFPRAVLEAMRQPLETGSVSIARVNAHVTYPANFQLIAAMNPCRCGYLSDPGRACGKAPRCAVDYQSKISGPLLDRFDMYLEVPEVDHATMLRAPEGEPSAQVAERVATAREIQRNRYASQAKVMRTNADAPLDVLEQIAMPQGEGKKLLEQASGDFKLSMRGFIRTLRVARTIADLAGSESVTQIHLAEALSYRNPATYLTRQAA